MTTLARALQTLPLEHALIGATASSVITQDNPDRSKLFIFSDRSRLFISSDGVMDVQEPSNHGSFRIKTEGS